MIEIVTCNTPHNAFSIFVDFSLGNYLFNLLLFGPHDRPHFGQVSLQFNTFLPSWTDPHQLLWFRHSLRRSWLPAISYNPELLTSVSHTAVLPLLINWLLFVSLKLPLFVLFPQEAPEHPLVVPLLHADHNLNNVLWVKIKDQLF